MSFLSFIKSLGHCPDKLAEDLKTLTKLHKEHRHKELTERTEKGNIKAKR